MREIKLILSAPDEKLAFAFDIAFAGYSNVEIYLEPFEEIREFDCMVSAANSFGLMDGGVDAAITQFFGDQLQKRVQDYIVGNYLGEQPVGSAFVIETGNVNHPWLIHAPTMRTPQLVCGTDVAYRATWAALISLYQHNLNNPEKQISSVVFPGMGTGCGQLNLTSAALQMSLAWTHFNKRRNRISWHMALQTANKVNSIVF